MDARINDASWAGHGDAISHSPYGARLPPWKRRRSVGAKRLMDATLDHNIERRRALVANGHKLALAGCAAAG